MDLQLLQGYKKLPIWYSSQLINKGFPNFVPVDNGWVGWMGGTVGMVTRICNQLQGFSMVTRLQAPPPPQSQKGQGLGVGGYVRLRRHPVAAAAAQPR